ncbi:prepilin peptidase [Mameliella sediminis]|uniref:prepilin peptidase n=1 Tax=Mameliella sediminis TaxID=2836866 RepID=UPI001C44DA3E|nr:prepilin peptidase [Mameliella sediminis]MBY6116603.1 prepilin peptidase [Antarctobacter heliothermus]MBY6146356.1 prepilin peptidase [Mameliella alba]MBV7396696.1 prepilin peptidase [Mameliella sediminis]MBY6162986.1 prepilin peptidase [Mameliella alba]MBY6171250.1 prepilin peptidase [Mameliella alba]
MSLSASAAMWFLPFVLPICIYICYTDMKGMRIPNHAVVALFLVYLFIGAIALPLDAYFWRYLHLIVVLVAGIALNAGGAMGAGDAKFAAAAAPLIHIGDLRFLMALFAANLLAAFVAHRLAKRSPLRQLAPHWHSWESGSKFPMGLALGGTLAIYLGLGILYGQPAP